MTRGYSVLQDHSVQVCAMLDTAITKFCLKHWIDLWQTKTYVSHTLGLSMNQINPALLHAKVQLPVDLVEHID